MVFSPFSTAVGNANAVNGLTAGNTQPNQSTRTEFDTTAGTTSIFKSTLNAQSFNGYDPNNIFNFDPANPSAGGLFLGDVSLTTTAKTNLGIPVGPLNLGGSAAVSGGTALGLNNADLNIGTGGVTGTGTIYFQAAADATSTSSNAGAQVSATDPTRVNDRASAAAVVDLAGVGFFNSSLTALGSAGTDLNNGQATNGYFFQSTLSGTADADGYGTQVGGITAPGTGSFVSGAQPSILPTPSNYPAPRDPLDGSGVNSILNLNSRGLNPQTQYFQDPISPFFAQFNGLIPGPLPSNTLNSVPTGSGDISIAGGNIVAASAIPTGSSTADTNKGDVNAFAGVFSSGITLVDNIVNSGDGVVRGFSQLGVDSGVDTPVTTSSSTGEGSASAITNSFSVGAGTAAIRQTANAALLRPNPAGGLYGGTTPIAPAQITVMGSGDITGVAQAVTNTTATSTKGDVVTFTGGLNGSGGNTLLPSFVAGNPLSVGIFNLDITGGMGQTNDVNGFARADYTQAAQATEGGARSSINSITGGIIGADLSGVPLGTPPANTNINLDSGTVNALGDAITKVTATTMMGTSDATGINNVSGLANVDVNIATAGSIGGSAYLRSTVTAEAV